MTPVTICENLIKLYVQLNHSIDSRLRSVAGDRNRCFGLNHMKFTPTPRPSGGVLAAA